MTALINTPIDELVRRLWGNFPSQYKKALGYLVLLHLLAFGFEMTNLTLHHDDLSHIQIQSTILGHYLGRFGTGWLHYYTQGAYVMPFWQMTQALVLMSLYALVIAHLWGLRRTLDIVLVGGLMVVFPFMAHVYQYNTTMATYTVAHLLAALSILLAVQARVLAVILAATCLFFAFSIYQSVANNAAAIFLVWLLMRWSDPDLSPADKTKLWRPSAAAFVAALAGGLSYVAVVKTMDIPFDSYQGAGEAFELGKGLDPVQAMRVLIEGSRAFYLWPEHYFPLPLKLAQLALLAGAFFICLWSPPRPLDKLISVVLLGLVSFSPRFLQMLHPHGHFHQLTLTAYAVVVAGVLALILRRTRPWAGNGARLLAIYLILGYVIQCNWISTVNLLNTKAHFHLLGQVLARVRSLPADTWDGHTIVVVGELDMASTHPYRPAIGIASRFMDAKHMDHMARLLRESVHFMAADVNTPQVLEYANTHRSWPAAESVTAVNGQAVVVLSSPANRP